MKLNGAIDVCLQNRNYPCLMKIRINIDTSLFDYHLVQIWESEIYQNLYYAQIQRERLIRLREQVGTFHDF